MHIISKRGKAKQHMVPSNEVLLCSSDVTYFMNNFVKQDDPQHGWFQLMLNAPQTRYMKTLQNETLVISKQPRRAGQTTSSLGFLVWRSMFNRDHHSVAVAPNNRMANLMSDLVRDMATSVPAVIRPSILQTKPFIQFDNGSSIRITSADAGAGALKSLSINTGFIADMALLKPFDQRVVFYEMANCMQQHAKMFIASTPRSVGDTFHTLWGDAVKGSRFVPIEVKWQEYMTAAAFMQLARTMPQDVIKTELECEFI